MTEWDGHGRGRSEHPERGWGAVVAVLAQLFLSFAGLTRESRIGLGLSIRHGFGNTDGRSDVAYYVYILASKRNGTLYVGMTNDLPRRTFQHKQGLIDGFTKKHEVHNLVHFEAFEDVGQAIRREKAIKHWSRAWKIALIEQHNPAWRDLYGSLQT